MIKRIAVITICLCAITARAETYPSEVIMINNSHSVAFSLGALKECRALTIFDLSSQATLTLSFIHTAQVTHYQDNVFIIIDHCSRRLDRLLVLMVNCDEDPKNETVAIYDFTSRVPVTLYNRCDILGMTIKNTHPIQVIAKVATAKHGYKDEEQAFILNVNLDGLQPKIVPMTASTLSPDVWSDAQYKVKS